MIDDENDSDADIATDVLPAAVDEDAVPLPLDKLAPWHKPRKQYIREKQWALYSKRLLANLKDGPFIQLGPSGKAEAKYLTLPGIDYLDVRVLSECCNDFGIQLTSTGFLSTGESNPTRARAQYREESLKQAGHISDRSITFARQIEEICSTKSQAYRDLRRRGPFHIVNVDACGSIAPPSADHAQRLIDAIYRIVELQLEICSGRWLLFLTTDARKNNVSSDTMKSFVKAIDENAQENAQFEQGTIDMLSPENGCSTSEQAVASALQKQGEPFLRLFALGFSKWVLHLAKSKGWRLKMHQSYYYSTTSQDDQHPSMPCLAFEFLPPDPALVDQFGAANVTPQSQDTNENSSIRVLEKVAGMEDLDARISTDAELRHQLTQNTKELLKEAGYAASALAEFDLASTE